MNVISNLTLALVAPDIIGMVCMMLLVIIAQFAAALRQSGHQLHHCR